MENLGVGKILSRAVDKNRIAKTCSFIRIAAFTFLKPAQNHITLDIKSRTRGSTK
jgi:hypothetical protein